MDNPLHILQVTNRLPWPLNDGGNLATYNVTRHLHADGQRVTLASINTQKHHQDPNVLAHVAEVHTVDLDTSLKPFDAFKALFSPLPYNILRFRSPDFEHLLQEIVGKTPPDIVQLEGSYQALFIPAIRAVRPKVPIILRSHNIEWRIWQRLAENESNPLKRLYLRNMYRKIRRFEERTLHDLDGLVAITEDDAQWYLSQGYQGKLVTIPAGADFEQYDPGESWAPAPSIGFIGSLEWEPNVQGLQWMIEKVWPQVKQQCPEAEFHIAGKNPPEHLQAWGKVDGVTFHGMVPSAPEFIRGFRIFVVPLLSGSGMRLKIVEALAMRKCVLSTTVGAEGIEIRPGTDFLQADQPDEFALQLIQLIQHPAQSMELARTGFERIRERYDWKNLIQRYLDFYQTLQ